MKPHLLPVGRRVNELTDAEYIQGLKENNSEIVRFFFYEFCRYTLNDIRNSVFHGTLDYDDLVDELYLYLSENQWHKMDTFQGLNGCHLKSWMVTLCWRFFVQRRQSFLGLPDNENVDVATLQSVPSDEFDIEMWMDVESTFSAMPNPKYVMVLRMLLHEGFTPQEVARVLHTNIANVYNIKHRAIVQFIQTYCEK